MSSEARLKKFENMWRETCFLCQWIQSKIFSLCLKNFPCVTTKFPVFSLSGKSKTQIPCFPCAVATMRKSEITERIFKLIPDSCFSDFKIHWIYVTFSDYWFLILEIFREPVYIAKIVSLSCKNYSHTFLLRRDTRNFARPYQVWARLIQK